MKPIRQTKFGDPEGNCLAAAIASILELEEIPDLPGGEGWWNALKRWCAPRGLEPVYFDCSPAMQTWLHDEYAEHYMVSGKSERGFQHVVVAQRNEIVHDPHPSGAGLVTIDGYLLLISIHQAREWEIADLHGGAA